MNFDLFVIYDKVKGEYSNPVVAYNERDGKRWFRSYVSKFEYPSDFDLFHVGSYCSKTGVINSNSPLFVMNGLEVLTDENK